jgi:nitrite reductase/ring-hydroxylating ferredoxin subunit
MTTTDEGAASADAPAATGDVSRRSVLRGVTVGGAALPLLAACGGGGSGGSGGSGSGGSGGSGDATVAISDVPVGGGKILKPQGVVVTQPTKGDFKAFTATCTHQGCTVGKIVSGEIICPCHHSHFSIKDGSNTQGPNDTPAGSVQPLAAKKVTKKGDQLSIG